MQPFVAEVEHRAQFRGQTMHNAGDEMKYDAEHWVQTFEVPWIIFWEQDWQLLIPLGHVIWQFAR